MGKVKGKKLTRQMKIELSRLGMNAEDWRYLKTTSYSLVIVNSRGEVKEIRW